MEQAHREARYYLEHQLLPKLFYEGTIGFVNAALKEESYLYDICREVFQAGELTCPYTREQFSVKLVRASEKEDNRDYLIVLEFPEPEEPILCHRAIGVFDMDFDTNVVFTKAHYYTVEKTYAEWADVPVLCGWTKENVHENFGLIDHDVVKQLEKALALYDSETYGGDHV